MEQTRCIKVRLPQKEKRQGVCPAVRWRMFFVGADAHCDNRARPYIVIPNQ